MILITDSETFEVILDVEGDKGDNPNALGTYTGPGVMSGPVYHGVKAWIGPNLLNPKDTSVFVQWIDKSTSNPAMPNPGRLHTAELPYPAPGGVHRFLVSVD